MPKMTFDITAELDESISTIEKDLAKIAEGKLQILANKIGGIILTYMQKAIVDMLYGNKLALDFSSNGEFAQMLGIKNIFARYYFIINKWADSAKIEVIEKKIVNNEPYIVFRFSAIDADYQDVLSMPEAFGASVSKKNTSGKSTIYPWLQWLLFEGEKVVVRDFVYISPGTIAAYGNAPPRTSRTGAGIMTYTGKTGSHEGWRIPKEFAGTQNNNFVTRAIDANLDNIIAELSKRIEDFTNVV